MENYHELVRECLENGELRDDRTGVGTYSLFGRSLRYDLQEGFPLLTTKRTHFTSIVVELLWFLRGETNVKWLQEHGVTIWNEWANEDGELGPVYGKQWRAWQGPNGEIDQIARLIEGIKTAPFSRRHVVTAWNPADILETALPPCHVLFQMYVSNDQRLCCHVYQRSADVFLGLPFNIASYALLTEIIGVICGYRAGDLVLSFGDVHLYANHVEHAKLMLSREHYLPPSLLLDSRLKDIDSFKVEDFVLIDYDFHPAIKADIAV